MSELRNRPIRKFNPGTLQPDEEVIEQFVVRKHELDIVLDVLRGNVDSPSCQHVLVVAPRGRGKTMLLARVAAELRTAGELTSRLFPVRFMEESQEIFNLADFWLETLFHLARESATHDPELAQELRETHAALTTRWRERALEEYARAAVLAAADRLGKKLVLMVENLQALCENVNDDFGWKLRGALQSEPQIILLATATSRFEGLDDAQEPFFELFRIVDLQRLDTDECRRLWQVVSGDTVSRREIRPLQILTGGNPRLLVIVAGFAQHRSLRQLMEELVKLIDEHTEYFRSHLEVLAKTERRVYIAVIDLWQASRTGEIAARARMDVRTVSTMLGRLVDRGVVIVEGSGKKRLYSAERLYSIYYKLRRERDEAAVIGSFIYFMVSFYSEDELAEMSGTLMAEAAKSKAIREGIKRAMAELPQVNSVFSSMAWPGLEEPSNEAAAPDNGKGEQLFQEILTAFEERAFEKVVETVDRLLASQSAVPYRVSEVHLAWTFFLKGLAYDQLGVPEAALAAYDAVSERFGSCDASEILFAWTLSKKGDIRKDRGEFEAALAAYDEVVERFGTSDVPEVQECVAVVLVQKGITRAVADNIEAALAEFDKAIECFGTSDAAAIQKWVVRALICRGMAREELGEAEGALAAYDEVVERFGTSDVPEIRVEVARALVYKGVIQADLSRAEEALHTCEELERRLGVLTGDEKSEFTWRAMRVRTKALLVQERHGAAMDTFRSAYAMFVPGNETMMREMLRLVPDLIAAGASEHELVEILSSDRAKSDTLLPLVVALRQRIGEEVRAPAEVLEVAADIHERIEAKTAKPPLG